MARSTLALLALCLAVGPSTILAISTEGAASPQPTLQGVFRDATGEAVEIAQESVPQLIAATVPAPKKIQQEGWEVIEYFEVDDGYIATYAPEDMEAFNAAFDGKVPEGDLAARQLNCGRPANFAKCWSYGDRGTASACEYLWQQLELPSWAGSPSLSSQRIPSNARHVCRGDTGGECCTSWGSHGATATYHNLANGVKDTFFCIDNGIYARVENVIIGDGPCTHQCVSSRGGYCPPYNGNTR